MTELSNKKKDELIALAKEENLPAHGTKADLINRLHEKYTEAQELKEKSESIVDEIDDAVDDALEVVEDLTEGTKIGKYVAWLNDRPQVKRLLLLGLVALALTTGLYTTTL